jgi:hypothetical protein
MGFLQMQFVKISRSRVGPKSSDLCLYENREGDLDVETQRADGHVKEEEETV